MNARLPLTSICAPKDGMHLHPQGKSYLRKTHFMYLLESCSTSWNNIRGV